MGLLWQRLPVPLSVVSLDGQDTFGGQQFGNLHRAFPRNAQVKNPFDNLGGFLVHDPLLLFVWPFLLPIGGLVQRCSPAFPLPRMTARIFLAGIAGVEVVEQVAKRGKIIVPLVAVHAVIDGDISNVTFRKKLSV